MNKRTKKKKNTGKTATKLIPTKADPIISSPSSCLFINAVLSERWKIIEKIGEGSFGLIFIVEDLLYKEKPIYAMKVENLHSLNLSYSLLQKEAKILAKLESEAGFPRLIKFFPEYSNNYLIMTLLGQNLNILMKKCNGCFTLNTVLKLGYFFLVRLESLHSKGLLHRDIKPENIVVGANSDYNKVFFIDFGLSKPYLDENGVHIPMVEKKGLVGTARYASINAHKGLELSRRDDIESMIYVLVYLANGVLPWQNIPGDTKDCKYLGILKQKSKTTEESLCQGLPVEFSICLKYVKSLQFEETPNYKFLKGLFTTMMEAKKIELDDEWDWRELYEGNKAVSRNKVTSEQALGDPEKITTLETAIKEKMGCSLTNIENNVYLRVSLGTSKLPQFTRCDLDDTDLEEREINRFFMKENIKPKFLLDLEDNLC